MEFKHRKLICYQIIYREGFWRVLLDIATMTANSNNRMAKNTTTTPTSTGATARSSEFEKMQKLVELCGTLQDIGFRLRAEGYNTDQTPVWFYSDCKAIVNHIEGLSRDFKVKPSMLTAVRFRNGKRLPVSSKRLKNNNKKVANGSKSH